ncbi:transcriptional regulator, LysR family [Sorangium cellulosum So ce56]|uniref:Transcriptional regulator, LysR family n=1 Tax=Sorangium cellulosum (strain So ce56) TaxID=448385 RepID=A9EUA0_SORC5|nr:LysR family transcriptional regulator [Sorangium cellulosum]CAN91080.1 transcriptional regulator, LysR family [Sorangium cellulosum So ce56]
MLDWDDLRYFLAVARHGNLSAAARVLKVTQPTVGRRVAAFERRLGARLFQRSPSGFALSAAGESVLGHAERMEQDALAAERAAAGRDAGLRGHLRITASEWLATRVLGPLLVPFLARHPAISVDLIADARWLSLPRREADIALRAAAFEHHEVFQREVARIGFGLYASEAYLADHGPPDWGRQCEGHTLVTMNDEPPAIADLSWVRAVAAKARVAARTNGREPQATMGAAGVGLVCLPRYLGDATAGLRLLSPPSPPPGRKLWLGVHRDTRGVPRVKALVAFVADALGPLRSALDPGARPRASGDERPRYRP